ncbi:hypothetical protein OLMES_1524 [Oleiphilus messinensis]|uniref:Uncharacterized protein n=1 Tax=Oleiphilus messinensis TaxID=141451 RepID=A0A1Y0I5W4_9GAMM|nr:hypothetical protein [Oleiphilus messinensis]ARU55599.1 hypothetical protein OLMES_1524 [Oleiphilus messinensis]
MLTEDLHSLLSNFFAISIVGTAFLTLFSLIIVGVTLAPRLKHEFEKEGQYEPMSPWLFWISSVAVCCVFRARPHNKYMYPYFRGFDVYRFSNLIERMFCYISMYGFFITVILAMTVNASDIFLGTEFIND